MTATDSRGAGEGEALPPGTTFDSEALATAVTAVMAAADGLDVAMKGAHDAGLSWDDCASMHDTLERARSSIARNSVWLRKWAGAGMWDYNKLKRQELPGVGLVERVRESTNVRWDDPETVAARIIDAHMDDRADGELPTPWEVRDWLLSAAAVGYWRTTALQDVGIDPDDHRTREQGDWSVKIIRSG